MIEIRDVEAADLPALESLREPLITYERKLDQARTGLVRFLLATENRDVVGFASLFLDHPAGGPRKSHVPKLSDLHVGPSHRRRGVGRRLVQAREDIARNAGHGSLYVSVDPEKNPAWLGFFLRRGYRLLQDEPYVKTERWLDRDGQAVPVEAWRHDLVLEL